MVPNKHITCPKIYNIIHKIKDTYDVALVFQVNNAKLFKYFRSNENLQDENSKESDACCSEGPEDCQSLFRQLGIHVCSCLLCLPCCDCVLHLRYKCVGISCCSCNKKNTSKDETETVTRTEYLNENGDNVSLGSENEEVHRSTNQNPIWTVEDFSGRDNAGFVEGNEEFLTRTDEPFSSATLDFPVRHNRTKSMPLSKSLHDLKRSNFKNMTISSQRQLPRHALSVGKLEATASVQSLENVYIKGFKQTAV